MRAAASALRLPRGLAAALHGARVPRPRLSLSPRGRRRAAIVALAAAALGLGYFGWFRDSSLVRVEEVTVTGLTTRDAARVRAALELAAREMTTLHVRRDELERAVAGYPAVRDLRVRAEFPNALAVEVVEHRPVALLSPGRVPVAADGTVLRGVPVEHALPSVRAGTRIDGGRIGGDLARALVLVAGTAPAPLLERVRRVGRDRGRGLVAELRDGPRVYFGDATRLRAKWLAAARVLADPGSAGATYVDVRLPGRPVAGGLAIETIAPVAPAGPQPLAPPGTAQPGAAAAPQAGAQPGAAPGAQPPPQPAPVQPAPAQPGAAAPPATAPAG